MRRWTAWGADLADLVLPRRCLGCAAAGEAWCLPCREHATVIRRHEPQPCPAGFPVTVVASTYAEDTRAAIIGFKDRGRRDLTTPLAGLLAAAVIAHEPPADGVLLPIPSAPAAARGRGGDHLVRLATRAARYADLPVVIGLGARPAPDAVGLDSAGRMISRRRALYARRGMSALVTGRYVVLLDDLVTTGASLAVAADLVLRCGASVVVAACVAATERQVVQV